MSHLTTLIGRIRRKEELAERCKYDVTKEGSFQNTLINLAEFMLYYRGEYSDKEREEAGEILKRYGLGHLIKADQDEIEKELHKLRERG